MREVLQEKGIVQNAQCRVCNNGRETILHVLRECMISKHTWRKLGIVDDDQSFFNGNLCEWLENNVKRSSFRTDYIPWHILFPFAIWKL